jgi:hypothetical protein
VRRKEKKRRKERRKIQKGEGKRKHEEQKGK